MTTTPEMSDYCPHFSSYKHGCRCASCRGKQRRYQAHYRRNKAEREWGVLKPRDRISPEASEKALWSARHDIGLTLNEIARGTGLSKRSVHEIYRGQRKYVERATEEKILAAYGPNAVVKRKLTGREPVSWDGEKWKIYALFAQGWTQATLRNILKDAGRQHGFIDHLSGDREHIEIQSFKQIDWLVETVGDRRGPSKINPTHYQRLGIFPLIHYTENGELIRESLTKEQRARRVRSKHGKPSSRRHGHGPRPRRGGGN